jgi:hypothetical protein
MNKEILAEIIVAELKKLGYTIVKDHKSEDKEPKMYKQGFFVSGRYIESKTTLPKGKNLLTEYDVRQYLKSCGGKKEIVVPENTIIGPLAEELINSLEIKVIRKKV